MKIEYKKYLELDKEIQKRLKRFNSFFAFNEEQLNEGLKKIKCSKNELISCGYGEFINKKDIKKYLAMWIEINKMRTKFLKNDENLLNALCYEMLNHEFGYTYEIEPVLNSLNLTYEKLTDRQKEILNKAKETILNKEIY